jgi:hypothetical protein
VRKHLNKSATLVAHEKSTTLFLFTHMVTLQQKQLLSTYGAFCSGEAPYVQFASDVRSMNAKVKKQTSRMDDGIDWSNSLSRGIHFGFPWQCWHIDH